MRRLHGPTLARAAPARVAACFRPAPSRRWRPPLVAGPRVRRRRRGCRSGTGSGGRARAAVAAVGGRHTSSTSPTWSDGGWHPGRGPPREVTTMLWTSAVIPPVATWHRVRGWWRHRAAAAWPPAPRAVLFDRDGTLVHDVPYNGDPACRRAGAPALARRSTACAPRACGSGWSPTSPASARGLLSARAGRCRQRRGRRPARPVRDLAGLPARARRRVRVPQAAARHGARRPRAPLGVRPEECVVIGDIGADAEAARAAGARSVLVPTPVTRAEEVAAAPVVATDLVARGGPRPRVATWLTAEVAAEALAVRLDSDGDVLLAGPAPAPARADVDSSTCSSRRRGRRGRAAAGRRRRARGRRAVDGATRRRRSTRPPSTRWSRGCVGAATTRSSSSPPSTRARCRWRCSPGWAGIPIVAGTSDDFPGRCSTCGTAGCRRATTSGSAAATRWRPCARVVAAAGHPRPRDDRLRRDTCSGADLAGPRATSSCTPPPRCPPAASAGERAAGTSRRSPAHGWRVVVTGGPGDRGLGRAVPARRRRPPGGPTCAAGRGARRRRGRRRGQHRAGAPGGRGRHPGRLPLRPRRAARSGGGRGGVPDGRARRPARGVRAQPGPRLPVPGHPCTDVPGAAGGRGRRPWPGRPRCTAADPARGAS